jgi:AcrR family transcriptional regulator
MAAKKSTRVNTSGAPRARVRKSSAPARRVRLLPEDRRSQLVSLALERFSGRAYDDVSIDDIAEAAGISKGLLYHYFPTKRDFYVAALDKAARELVARTASDPAVDPALRPVHGIDAYLDYVSGHGKAFITLMRGGLGADAEIGAILERTRDRIAQDILGDLAAFTGHTDVARSPLVRSSVRGWIGYMEAVSVDWLERQDVPRDRIRDVALGLLVRLLETVLPADAARNLPASTLR